MQETIASLDFSTRTMDLSDLAAFLDVSPGPGSHSRGDPRGRATPWDSTRMRIDADNSVSPTLELQIRDLLAVLANMNLKSKPGTPRDFNVILTVAKLFDTAYCSVEIAAADLAAIVAHGVSLDVVCYPSDFSS